MRRDERHVNWAEKVHEADRKAANVQATPRQATEPAAAAETRAPVQQPQRITEAMDAAAADDDTGNNNDMNVDYEATSAEEECGPSS